MKDPTKCQKCSSGREAICSNSRWVGCDSPLFPSLQGDLKPWEVQSLLFVNFKEAPFACGRWINRHLQTLWLKCLKTEFLQVLIFHIRLRLYSKSVLLDGTYAPAFADEESWPVNSSWWSKRVPFSFLNLFFPF